MQSWTIGSGEVDSYLFKIPVFHQSSCSKFFYSSLPGLGEALDKIKNLLDSRLLFSIFQ